MMKILSKSGNELIFLGMDSDVANKGDYLLIDDCKNERKMIVQIYDEDYLSSQTLIEDIVKDEIVSASSEQNFHDPLNISSLSSLIRDARIFKAKIRSTIDISGKLSSELNWIPSRVYSSIRRLTMAELSSLLDRQGTLPIHIGKSGKMNEDFVIYAEDLDGKLNIITGRKESGKSHLSKVLIKSLVEHGAYVIVFDLNREYQGLGLTSDGKPSEINDKVILLDPGSSLRFNLDYCGKSAITNVLRNTLDITSASLREFLRIWERLENNGDLNIESLGNLINRANMNELVRDALVSRYHTLKSSNLFSADSDEGLMFEKIYRKKSKGAALVINLQKASTVTRKIIVELVLSKMVDLLERGLIKPIFLFAEEAHLYVKDTYWEDIITRMRHFGIFTTFVTNQPDALSDGIYRQVDNIFLFNFMNDADLEKISRVSLIDTETVKSVVRTLPQRNCLIIGKVVREMPIVMNVKGADMMVYGETKKFFG